ncbi:MAG: hypothetical protein GKC03_06965 [Methanomassiliicoccales archaeon]|nr:hypothetical protein [Methanomassiliicoccales archaeon]NYT14729.1 hypothetical protein [Methanomassiliicoccales archaeon]
MHSSCFTFQDDKGIEIFVYRWLPDEWRSPKANVQISHGTGEHAAMCSRFAGFTSENGYFVHANDYRGHGRTLRELCNSGLLGPGGWNAAAKDLSNLSIIVEGEPCSPFPLRSQLGIIPCPGLYPQMSSDHSGGNNIWH